MAGCGGHGSPFGFDGRAPGVPLSTHASSPPSSPLPTPNRLEVPGTPLRHTPQSSGFRRSALVSPSVLFPEPLNFNSAYAFEAPPLVRTKRKLSERLANAERTPLNFSDKVARPLDTATHNEDDFTECGELGHGSFAKVSKVLDRDSRYHALKRIVRHASTAGAARSMILKERNMHLRTHGRPNIVQSTGFSCSDPKSCFLLTELCDGGSLAADIAARMAEQRFYEEPQLLRILRDLATGLAEMHKVRLVHCDVKPANVLIQRTPSSALLYKIGDLGNAVCMDSEATPDVGDFKYTAPELLNFEVPGAAMQVQTKREQLPKTDVYSMGLTLLEAASLCPLPNAPPAWRVIRESPPAPLPRYSPALNTLLARLLSPLPQDRPWAADVAADVCMVDTLSPPALLPPSFSPPSLPLSLSSSSAASPPPSISPSISPSSSSPPPSIPPSSSSPLPSAAPSSSSCSTL